jgi:hypothetical protein
MEELATRSPDLLHNVVMRFVGEIRFGPAYYSLVIDELSFGNRVFGNACLWSPNSRFFAVQEWETTSEGHGPKTRLLLIDIIKKREYVLSRAEQGFIEPKKFEDNKLIYEKKYLGQGIVKEFEIEFLSLDRWENLS